MRKRLCIDGWNAQCGSQDSMQSNMVTTVRTINFQRFWEMFIFERNKKQPIRQQNIPKKWVAAHSDSDFHKCVKRGIFDGNRATQKCERKTYRHMYGMYVCTFVHIYGMNFTSDSLARSRITGRGRGLLINRLSRRCICHYDWRARILDSRPQNQADMCLCASVAYFCSETLYLLHFQFAFPAHRHPQPPCIREQFHQLQPAPSSKQ